MDVVDGLASVGANVQHGPVPALRDALFAGDLRRRQLELSQELAVRGVGGVERRQVLLWNDQDVNGRLWADVSESDDLIIDVNERRGDLAPGDPAKEAIGGAHWGCSGWRVLGTLPPDHVDGRGHAQ